MYRRHAAGFLTFALAAFFTLVASAAENDWPNGVSWPAWAATRDAAAQIQPVAAGEARKSIYVIAGAIAGKKQLDAAEIASVQTTFDELRSAMQQTIGAIDAWNDVLAPDCDIEKANKAKIGPVAVTRQTVADIAKALPELKLGSREELP